MCLVGIVILAWGAVGFIMGIVHVADPALQRQSDPLFRIASAVVDVAQGAYANQAIRDPKIVDGLSKAKTELDHQARQAGLNELVHGLVFALVGFAIFGFHWKRAEQPRGVMMYPAPQYAGAGPPAGGPPTAWQMPPQQPPGPPGQQPPGV